MNDQIIAVGVDGSQGSAEALRFAIREARLRGGVVRAITAWQSDAFYSGVGGFYSYQSRYAGSHSTESTEAYEKRATELQEKAIESVLRREADPPVIERQLVRGEPGQGLVQHSQDAALLVVGTEHKGMLKRAMDGSTSVYCSRHAQVPVVVVPHVDHALHGAVA